jgi:hypothetical protein
MAYEILCSPNIFFVPVIKGSKNIEELLFTK